MEGDRRVLQGESRTLGRRQWQAALEVLPRLLQGRLVSREQVVHRPYHDEMRLHADTGEPRAVGSLVAGDPEFHPPPPPGGGRGDGPPTPPPPPPPDEAAARRAGPGPPGVRPARRG